MLGPAVHRTIVAVDVEGFGDRRRTNRNQVAVREGLYLALEEAFREAGIPWSDGDHEDRGDGVFILAGPETPKILFAESLPTALVSALHRHNDSHPGQERIRLRMAVHAGEINYDQHGATSASINLTFRLIDSAPLKEALAASPGVLALIASSWFFDEVIRQNAADTSCYQPVTVTVKETTATAWICLPDNRARLAPAISNRPGAVTAASIHKVLPGQVDKTPDVVGFTRLTASLEPASQSADNRPRNVGGLPVTVPLGRLPAEVRGRDALLAELREALTRKRRRRSRTYVLTGMGGLGKSTVALAAAQMARARGWTVWWITATDDASLAGGVLEVLHQLRAPESVVRPVRDGSATAAERTWAYLNAGHLRGRWLLVFDNADSPAVLAAAASVRPADYTGWLRPDPAGLVIVTTRIKDPLIWGTGVATRELSPLDDVSAAQVLTDLVPRAFDPDQSQAADLGRRLGGLPLALHLAGTCLASPFTRWRSFADYRRALDGAGMPSALADLDIPGSGVRDTVRHTWDLSLGALAADGQVDARRLLSLLSCYSSATLIPVSLLRAGPVAELLTRGKDEAAGPAAHLRADQERQLRDSLRNLTAIGLLELGEDKSGSPAVIVHPVVADATRARLLASAQLDQQLISRAAIRLLGAAIAGLDDQRPADWPTWRLVTPHVQTLLGWLAPHLDANTLASLLNMCDRTASALLSAGDLAMAEKLAVMGVSGSASLSEEFRARLAVRLSLGRIMVAQGRNAEAEVLFRPLVIDQQRVLGGDHPDTLESRNALSRALEYQARYGEAEDMYRQLLADSRRVLGGMHPLTLTSRRHLAWLTAVRGRYRDAEGQYLELVADRREALGDEHPDTLNARQGLAWILGLQGHYQEAEREFRRLLGDQRRIMGDDHPDTIDTCYRLARVVTDQGRYAEAEEMCQQVLADRRRVQGDDHPATAVARDTLARVAGLLGRYGEAEAIFNEVLAYQRENIGEKHPRTLATCHRRARVLADQGRHREAEQQFRQVLADREQILGTRHPDTLTTRHRLAGVLAGQGRHREAEQLFRQVLADREQILGTRHPDTEATRTRLARMASPDMPVPAPRPPS